MKDAFWTIPNLRYKLRFLLTFREWTRLSFSLGELGTFALFELPAFLWGTFIKMKASYLKCYMVFNQTLSIYL